MGGLIYIAGGTSTGFAHVMYILVSIAAVRAGRTGGIIAGLIASLVTVVLPRLLDVVPDQSLEMMAVRSVSFVLIGYLIGMIVERLGRQQRQTEELFLQSVSTLVGMLEANHKFTAGHSVRVAQISRTLAERMALPPRQCFLVTVGALLHDVGKVAIPREVLDKPGRLNETEFELVRRHPVEGHRILAPLAYDGAEAIREIVLHHHERLDGSGYPDGLQASRLGLLTRIVAVADVYEALISDRPYRPGRSPAEAMAVILDETRQGRFDEFVVMHLRGCVERDPYFVLRSPDTAAGWFGLLRSAIIP